MGYACPVCEVPQRDGEHLAHHLAFTAMLHEDDHEEWLAEHAPGWADREPAELAADVTEHADSAEYHEVFEDTVHDHDRARPDVGGVDVSDPGRNHGHGHQRDRGHERDHETEAILEEARELTRRMRSDGDAGSKEPVDSGPDGESGPDEDFGPDANPNSNAAADAIEDPDDADETS